MVDYVADVRKYAADADEKVVAGIVKHFGIAMREGSDSSFVAVSDKSELERVREGFLKKKCALTQTDADLDAAIKEVGERMQGENRKLRSTFCYLLAEKFDKLSLFGG
ncbi:MAG: DUF2853 family protein [Planctomycetes bacterium]|nr:DUF2853 family protein [Planctomycetota bacterium]